MATCLLIMAGCANIDEPDSYVTVDDGLKSITSLSATIGDASDTRVHIIEEEGNYNRPLAWDENDKISVFSDLKKDFITYSLTSVNGNSAQFSGEMVKAKQYFVALYPDEGWQMDGENQLLFDMDKCVVADDENGFKFNAPMLGTSLSTYNYFHFNHLTGMIHISVGNIHELTKVELSGNNDEVIGGQFSVVLLTYVFVSGGTNNLQTDYGIRPDNDKAKSISALVRKNLDDSKTDLYFIIPGFNTNSDPSSQFIEFEKGISLHIEGKNADGTPVSITKSTANPLAIKLGTVEHFSLIDVNAELTMGNDKKTAYVVAENDVLTFYYDNLRKQRSGESFLFEGSDEDIKTGRFERPYGRVSGNIEKVVFDLSFAQYKPASIAGIFSNMAKLKTIEGLENLNTTNLVSMASMFSGCTSLTSIDLSGLDTSNVKDMSGMFSGLALTSIDLSGLDTSNVTDISFMFSYCSALTSIDLSGLDTSNVTNMMSMFYGCKSLTSIDLSGLDTSNVTNMMFMFYGCKSLTSIELSGLDTSNVTNMMSMFYGCTSLTSIDLSGLDTSNVTSMRDMFAYCWALTNLDLSGFDTSNVTSMSEMFVGCSKLTSLDLSGFDTSKVENMSSMFAGCSVLTSLDLSNFDTSMVGNMSSMFATCSALASIDFSSFDTSKVRDMSWMFNGCSSLTELDMSGFNTSKVTNMSYLFSYCKSLTSIDLIGLDTSNMTDMSYMFAGCSALTNLDLSSFDTSKVTNMSSIFSGCSALTNLDLSSFDTSKVTNMSYMFSGCKSLTSLDLSSFDTSKVTNMSSMFRDCSSLQTIYAGNWNCSNSNSMFYGCDNLVGGKGTKPGTHYYSGNGIGTYTCETDARAAHIDGGKANPGLFTAK